jgi:hypothetical protein
VKTRTEIFGELDREFGNLLTKGLPSPGSFYFVDILFAGCPCMVSVNHSGANALWIGSTDHVAGTRRIWESRGIEATQAPDASGRTRSWITISLGGVSERALFVSLSSYICLKCMETGATTASTIKEALDEWKGLFLGRAEGLTLNELAGLLGELLTLQELAESVSARALDFWQGFEGESQDFRCGNLLIETKASIGQGNSLAINGLRQLERPREGALLLRHLRLQPESPQGISLATVIERLGHLGLDVVRLKECILRVGASPAQLSDASKVFRVMERRCYQVDDGFPLPHRGQFCRRKGTRRRILRQICHRPRQVRPLYSTRIRLPFAHT